MALSLDHKELLPFLPMIYVAWADGELSAQELEGMRALGARQSYLSAPAQEALSQWLDPQAPPSAAQLTHLWHTILQASAELPQERRSLVELGQALYGSEPLDAQTSQALKDLEQALGVNSYDAAALATDPPLKASPIQSFRALEPEAQFDLPLMRALLDGPFAERKDKVRALLQDPAFTYQDELPKEEYRELVLQWLHRLADNGLGALAFPDVLNSADGFGEFLAAFESLAMFDLSLVIKFGVQFGLFGGSIYFLGTEKHHKLLADVASVKLPGCFAMTELGHGSNVRSLQTTASFDRQNNQWIVHTPDEYARKEWIGNAAAHAKMATVFAQLEIDGHYYGVHAFLVPIRDDDGQVLPDVFIDDCGHKLGLNGVDNGRLWFDHVRIPADNLLDRFAQVSPTGEYSSPITSSNKRFFTMLGTLVGGRVSIAASALSASKSALTIALRYAAMRRQFGPANGDEAPILDFRTHQLRLMPLLANAYALSFGVQYLQQRYLNRSDEDEREVEGLAAGMKAFSSWNATHTIQTARECCGGQGYLSVNRFAALKADTDIFTTFEGDNTVLMQLLAKGLLTDYGHQFQDMSLSSAFRLIRGVAQHTMKDLDLLTARRTEREHLRDSDYHLGLLQYREDALVASAAKRFKKRLDQGVDGFEAMIQVQDHLMSLAHANIERVLLEQFILAKRACTDEPTRAKLNDLCDLFALHHIQRDLAWFMENGVIAAAKAKAIRVTVNELCEQVRHQAIAFTDAFAIPESCLAAPIAQSPVVPSEVSPRD